MDNQEFFNQLLAAMERQSKEIKTDIMRQMVEAMQEQTEVLTKMMDEKINAAETRINIKIENEVTKRIDSLFDDYKLVHEQQWELQHEFEALKRRLEQVEAKLAG